MRNLIQGIKNIIKWIPIIYKDRDWDYYYILKTLKFKLSNQSKYTLNKSRHINASKDVKMMDLCIKLIAKIQDEYYLSEWVDYEVVEHKYKKIENSELNTELNENILFTLKTEIISENFNDYFKKYSRIYKSIDDKECKVAAAIKISTINHNRAKKLLFKILENNIENWWC
jgi:hypothetical protein